jgi:hypothetical protein
LRVLAGVSVGVLVAVLVGVLVGVLARVLAGVLAGEFANPASGGSDRPIRRWSGASPSLTLHQPAQ